MQLTFLWNQQLLEDILIAIGGSNESDRHTGTGLNALLHLLVRIGFSQWITKQGTISANNGRLRFFGKLTSNVYCCVCVSENGLNIYLIITS